MNEVGLGSDKHFRVLYIKDYSLSRTLVLCKHLTLCSQ